MAVRGSYKGPKGSRYHTNQERLNQMKLKVLITIALLALASVASGQVVYDSVRVKVAPGVTCPSWRGRLRRKQSPSRLSTS